jgi:hypothetical protein
LIRETKAHQLVTTGASHCNPLMVGDLMGHINSPDKERCPGVNPSIEQCGADFPKATGGDFKRHQARTCRWIRRLKGVVHTTRPAMTGDAICDSAISETAVAMKAVSKTENFLKPSGTNIRPL